MITERLTGILNRGYYRLTRLFEEDNFEDKAKEVKEVKEVKETEKGKQTKPVIKAPQTRNEYVHNILKDVTHYLKIVFVVFGGVISANYAIGYSWPMRLLSFVFGIVLSIPIPFSLGPLGKVYFPVVYLKFMYDVYNGNPPRFYTFLPLLARNEDDSTDGWKRTFFALLSPFVYKENDNSRLAQKMVTELYKAGWEKSRELAQGEAASFASKYGGDKNPCKKPEPAASCPAAPAAPKTNATNTTNAKGAAPEGPAANGNPVAPAAPETNATNAAANAKPAAPEANAKPAAPDANAKPAAPAANAKPAAQAAPAAPQAAPPR
jgi:hypothetical protein